ncbi:MAG: hypothetical protein ACRC80_01805 [Waterburya sp.]
MHLFFSPQNSETQKEIITYSLMYGGLFSVFEIFKHRNDRVYGISPSRVIGATLGLVAGFYGSYLICILAGIFDGVTTFEASSLTSSSITVGISFGGAELSRQLGSFFAHVLLPVKY